jgi:zinc protease
MSAVVDPDKFEKARNAMLAEVEKLKARPIAAGELNKAVKQFISGMLATRKTMTGQAADLGANWLAANDLNFSARYLDAVKRVTPAGVQRVARAYLTTENRTFYALLPNGAAPKSSSIAEKTSDHVIQKIVLPNGLRLLVKEDHRLPFVEFRAVFTGGVLAETPGNNGITQLLSKMLLQGTKKRSAEDIAREIESVGGSVDTYGGNNSFGVNVEVMSGDFATGLGLLADVMLNPTFPASALEREQQVQIAGIRSQKDELLKSASKAMRRALFGNTGYGLDSLGTEESVQKTKPADLKSFHAKLVAPNNCVLAIYGDVKTASVKAAVQKAFARWKSNPNAPTPDALVNRKSPIVNSLQRVTETRDKKQAVLVIGYAGTTLHSDDRYALELLQESCSDLGSRLFLRIRDKLGLAYYVGAQNFPGLAPGYFAFYVGTEPDKAKLVEQELLKEAELLRTEGVTAEELKRAKAKVIGQKKIARQDLGSFAMTTALDELYGLGYANTDAEDAKFEAVTLDQVQAAAKKYLKSDALVISLVKPAKAGSALNRR